MSVVALNWAYEQRLPATVKAVLVALAHRHNAKTGQCNPAVETLAIMTGLSDRGVQKALRDLAERKLIRAVGGDKGGRGKSTNWAFLSAKGGTAFTLSTPLKGEQPTGFRKSLKGERGSPDREEIPYGERTGPSGNRRRAENVSADGDRSAPSSPLRMIPGGRP